MDRRGSRKGSQGARGPTGLRLTRRRIRAWARRFDRREARSPGPAREAALKTRLRGRRRAGRWYLTRAELVWLGDWKTPRIRPVVARNTTRAVRGVTEAALLVRDDGRRLRLLLGLPGVGLAVASVILHFAEPTRYPIYDARVRAALRRLGVRRRFPPTVDGWLRYADCLRRLARRHRVSLRTLDKALWLLGGG